MNAPPRNYVRGFFYAVRFRFCFFVRALVPKWKRRLKTKKTKQTNRNTCLTGCGSGGYDSALTPSSAELMASICLNSSEWFASIKMIENTPDRHKQTHTSLMNETSFLILFIVYTSFLIIS